MAKFIVTEWDKDDPLAPSPLPENLDNLRDFTERERLKYMARNVREQVEAAENRAHRETQ